MNSPAVVLVHGAMRGGWCWRRVLAPLRAAGYEVHAPTLTGLGERAHLLTADTGLATHVEDVVALVEAEELARITLVGHSYGALVVAGVAARVPQLIERVVILDGPIAGHGDSGASLHPAGASFLARARTVDGVRVLPPADAPRVGPSPADQAWLRRRLTPQPARSVTDPVDLPDGWPTAAARVFLTTTDDRGVRSPVPQAAVRGGWLVGDVPGGHDAMITRPDALAATLLDLLDLPRPAPPGHPCDPVPVRGAST